MRGRLVGVGQQEVQSGFLLRERRQPCAVAWLELVSRRCRVDFCFVNDGMNTYHHKGDFAARTISPGMAFLFTRLRIGAHPICLEFRGMSRYSPQRVSQ